MRLVLNTNVLVSAFVARGTSAELLEHCVLSHTIISSEFILTEFSKVLSKKFRFSQSEVESATNLLKSRLVLVKPHPVPAEACRDKSDLSIIGAALAGKCCCIVTGDKDLLVLKSYKSIIILNLKSFWAFEKGFD